MSNGRVGQIASFVSLRISPLPIASIALALTLLAGCATTPVPTDEATAVDVESVLDRSLLQARPGTHPVTIKRDAGMMGRACSTRIFVNGKPVADIRQTEKVVIHLPEGDHIFGARPNGICAGGTSETKATVRSNAPITLRIAHGSSGDPAITVTAF